jgi:hypothetical protein
MASTARKAAAVIAIAFCNLTAAAGAERPVAPRIVLSISNNANVDANVLARAGDRVREIYAEAGIEIVWHVGVTPVPAGNMRVTVILTTMSPFQQSAPASVLGAAARGEGGLGRIVYALWNRIEPLAGRGLSTDSTILGYVIAHEVGHLLLPRGHSSAGIMTGRWGPQDLHDAERGVLWFTRQEAVEMRRRIAQASPADTAAARDALERRQ